jgi:hypothetical protein
LYVIHSCPVDVTDNAVRTVTVQTASLTVSLSFSSSNRCYGMKQTEYKALKMWGRSIAG